VVGLGALPAAIVAALAEWRDLHWLDLRFAQRPVAVLILAILLSIVLLMLLIRRLRPASPGGTRVALPALLPVMRLSPLALLRHVPLVLLVAGIPLFAIALADPFTAFTREEVSRPGRRIAVMIDASTSMMSPFASPTLNTKGSQTYFTTVAAAESFMKMRMQGPNRDLISLIEFGSEAYVVTPFTTDYQSILLSMKLIGEWDEWQRFPDQGTIIMQAIQQGVRLFGAFDFLKASGNLMVIFTDGQDSQAMLQGLSLDAIMAGAREQKIPVYMIRMAYNKSMGDLLPDRMWRTAIERTGGRFYAAADENAILKAVREIDQLAPDRIDLREYSAQRPRFSGFTLAAVGFWAAAALLKLGFRGFRTFP
jgi:hypothetical protein